MVSSPCLCTAVRSFKRTFLLSLLVLILISHAIGILLPETGFDALWYHLPLIKDMAQSHAVREVTGVPQSLQPRLGDMIYVPGFLLFHEAGVKITAFFIMLILLFLVFKLARLSISKTYALLTVILIATFHTIAWGASSAYVDLIRAVFEVGLLTLLLKKKSGTKDGLYIALFLSGALLTKLVTLLFLPSFLILIYLKKGRIYAIGSACLTLLLCVMFKFPISFFWSVGHSLIGMQEISMSLRSFLFLPVEVSFHTESYLAPIFLFMVPFIYKERLWIWKQKRAELAFLVCSLATWVFIVPISVRYDLSAIILATILCVEVAVRVAREYRWFHMMFVGIALASIILNMSVRLGVHIRSLPYLLGSETESQYLRRFDTGILKGPLEKWYKTE